MQELGIDSYSSRSQLPGAAQTRRLIVKRQPSAELNATPAGIGDTKRQSPLAADTSPAAEIASHLTPSPKRAQTQEAGTSPTATEVVTAKPVKAFNVAAILSGKWLWIEELTHGVLSREQVHLVQAMTKALGVEQPKCRTSQFDWPIHNNTQLDLSVEAAQGGLAGFVQRQVEDFECQGLIVMGRACEQRLAFQQLRIPRCVRTVSTAEMLADPQLKKQAWVDLLPLLNPS